MPEGPEVRRFADILHSRLQSKKLALFQINEKSRYHTTNKLENLSKLQMKNHLISVCSRGKKIIFCFENDLFLISSLGLEGSWQFESGKHSGVHLIFTDDKEKIDLFYDDVRHFGTMTICTSVNELWEKLEDVGPDLLNGDVSLFEYREMFVRKTIQKMKIMIFMMEQKYFSGIGNKYRAEILYRCCISPHRIISSLSSEEIDNIYLTSVKVLTEGYEAPDLFICNAYNQKTDSDGNLVTKEVDSKKRVIHWVSAVQK